ncbi:hypothetical protein [Maribellus maritimus]|uniref:hypothetical protein n=1 Tax=Maribellus maritimus TaxID=2870838 RepID=UPI001EEC0057|nr:hypothetical protein [Maribellus maritimus]MCG6186843.1 hypothetical protein [Maribellus maritimus]
MKAKLIMLVLFFLQIHLFVESQSVLKLNLGEDEGTVISKRGNLNCDVILLENVVAGFEYSIDIEKTVELLAPLSQPPKSGGSGAGPESPCDDLQEKIDTVLNFQRSDKKNRTEKDLSKLVDDLKKELDKEDCNDISTINLAKESISMTTKSRPENIRLVAGEKLTIIITRDDKTWTFVFKGEQRGQWVASYGFGFTPKSLERSTYFLRQQEDTTTFQLFKADKAEALDLSYVPAIFYSYFPAQNFSRAVNHSVTAGLGFDLVAPVAFFGYNVMFNHNVGLSAGVAFQQQNKLKEQYYEGQIISTDLDKDQLHDQIYRPNFFLSINFRFGENPFKTNEEAEKE